jgi:type I restriction enzyme M protein
VCEDFRNGMGAQRHSYRFNIETENAFSILYNEINGRFDFDFYSPQNRKFLKILTNLETVRLGNICDIVKVKSKKLKNPNLTVEYVELSDINTHSYEIINSTTYRVHELPSRASYELQSGDIITAVAGNSVGTKKHATALVTDDFSGSICTNGFRVLRNFKIDSYYHQRQTVRSQRYSARGAIHLHGSGC